MESTLYNFNRAASLEQPFLSDLDKATGFFKRIGAKSDFTKADLLAALENFIANLSEAMLMNRKLEMNFASTWTRPVMNRMRKVLDYLKEEGFISSLNMGFYIPETGKFSRTTIVPTMKVFDVVKKNGEKRHSIIRTEGKELKIQDGSAKVLDFASAKFAKRVNIPIKGFYRVYNGDVFSGGRIYCSYQNLKKEQREAIKIDGEDTVEMDFPANHLNMLLAGRRTVCDPYDELGVDRETAKKAVQVVLNSKEPLRALSDRRPGAEFRWNYVKAKNFVDTFKQKFPELETQIGSGVGLRLQKIEGDVAARVMKWAIDRNEVVLPVHDSFIVKHSMKQELGEVMQRAWRTEVDRQILHILN